MKTIMDAVIELKGDLINTTDYHGDELYVEYLRFEGDYICTVDDAPSNIHQYICTREEFNTLVGELSTNFGRCDVNIVNEYALADKKPADSAIEGKCAEIDWSKAPDGYDYHLSHDYSQHEKGFCILGSNDRYYFSDGGEPKVQSDWVVTKKPQTKPVYTQAMCDVGEIPSVGAVVEFSDNTDFDFKFDWEDGDELECVFHSTDDQGKPIGVYRHKRGVTVSIVIELIRPLTPPIQLIDGEAYQFDFIGCAFLGFYHEEGDKFTASKSGLNSVICRWDECTNIKLLTVEGE